MKAKLNLTVDREAMGKAKAYAHSHQTSVSELVETFFKTLGRPKKKKTVLTILDKLPRPAQSVQDNLRESYYTSKAKKYGF